MKILDSTLTCSNLAVKTQSYSTLNIFNTSIHYSIERFAATTHINSTIYHSFLSYQPLAAPQNISTTRTGNLIHDPHGIFNFSNRGITGFGISKLRTKLELKFPEIFTTRILNYEGRNWII